MSPLSTLHGRSMQGNYITQKSWSKSLASICDILERFFRRIARSRDHKDNAILHGIGYSESHTNPIPQWCLFVSNLPPSTKPQCFHDCHSPRPGYPLWSRKFRRARFSAIHSTDGSQAVVHQSLRVPWTMLSTEKEWLSKLMLHNQQVTIQIGANMSGNKRLTCFSRSLEETLHLVRTSRR